MAFSQSFEFGNSTFMKLESQANHAIKDENSPKAKNSLEVISESPTESTHKSSILSASRNRTRFLQSATQAHKKDEAAQHRKFRRSKSDSILPKTSAKDYDMAADNYSEFFRSNFSFPNNVSKESQSIKERKDESLVRVSQIEMAFNKADIANGGEDYIEEECAENSLEKPIFSEDLQGLLGTEENDAIWKDSMPLPTDTKDYVNDPPEILHEISNFICTPMKDEHLNKELEISHRIFKESQAFHKDLSQRDFSLSCMSPDQLRFTQDLSSPTEKHLKIKDNRIQKCDVVNKNNSYEKDKHKNKPIQSLNTPQLEAKKTKVALDNLEALKNIQAWNLPLSVTKEYERKGVTKMFDWQVQCLSNYKVLFEHCNLVYSAPTSAGKTLVSEILLLKTVLEREKKVLLILPFISVVREKMFYLQDLLTTAGYRVEGFFGGYTPPGGFDSINVAICTIEKANSIVNKLLEQGKLDQIGTIVVDEVHLISDPGRGYILELLLAKILYMSRKYGLQIQVVTMSATLANVELLKKWLDAELFITDFRPVALQEMIKIGNKIYDNNLKILRSITEPSIDVGEPFPTLPNDADHVAQLCIETLVEGCSVVIFCPSKDWCENLAIQLAGAIHALGKQSGEWSTKLRSQLKQEAIDSVKEQMRDIPTGLDTVLDKCITYGCAFHHAGLTTEERDILEASFKAGALKVIVATSTLSSGVNLPARRVLIRSPLFGGKQMSSLTYRQMIGRAGRTGKDTLGESILICTDSNARIGKDLITADLRPISSCLDLDSSTHLKRALLEVISSGVATSKEDIDNFVNCTLLSAQKQLEQNPDETINQEYIVSALDFLIEYEFIRLQTNEETQEQYYVATRLGQACLASSMPPTDGLILFAELQKSRRCFVLESELHAVYLVTPYSVCYQLQDLDWLLFLDLWEKLTPAMKKVGELVGVKESFLVRAMRGQSKLDYKLMQIHKRFYTALALQELVNETPINKVAVKYKCSRGMLQSLQQMASTFAGIVTSFCNSLQWDTLSLIVSQFKERLYFGIHRDLIDLMRLPDLNHKRARALFDAGITSLVELASADILNIENILFDALSFDSAKKHDNENEFEAARRNEERNFFITGKAGLNIAEAAKMLIKDARRFVQYEIGGGNIKWTQSENKHTASGSKTEKELHMSCEENIFQNLKMETNQSQNQIKLTHVITNEVNDIQYESKENEKVQKGAVKTNDAKLNIDKGLEQEAILQLNNEPKPIINHHNNKPSIKSEEKIIVPEKQCNFEQNKSNRKPNQTILDESQTKFLNKPLREQNYCAVTISTQVNSNGINVTFEDDSKLLKAMNAMDEIVFSSEITNHDKQKENEKHTLEKRKSAEGVKENLNVTPPKVRKISSNIKTKSSVKDEKPSTIKRKSWETGNDYDVTTTPRSPANVKEIDEKPSTSKKAQRLLKARQLSEMKKQEWAKRKDEKETENTNETKAITTLPNATSDINVDKISPNNKKSHKKNIQNTPKTIYNNEKQETPKLPRRSPRNHSINFASKTQKPVKSPNNNIFGIENEESFTINTDINEALKEAEKFQQPFLMDIKNNSPVDEIPSSQQLIENMPANKTYSPHASKMFRSLRSTQKKQTQKSGANSKTEPVREQEIPNLPKESSTSIELSDASMENSLLKHPFQLNASHILSCSKVENESSSFKSIDIIDICGNQELFKGAFKEFMANRRLGFCLAIQQQIGRNKPLIGANLLLNQVAAADQKKHLKETFEFQIDDTNYLAGIAFSIAENVVYYMNMQLEGTCRGLTSEIKCKYLRMILKSSDHTLLVYDAKEQMKTLRKIMKEIEEISVRLEDPKVANWLLQPDKMLNLHNLAQQYAPECSSLVNLCGSGRGYSSYGLDSQSAILAKVRSSIEACVVIHILKGQIENLERIGTGQLHKFFIELEMPLQLCLCNMEYVGFPASSKALHKLFQQMVDTMKKLETKIYELNGSRFNLGSSSAVARVLGLHRKSNGRISTCKQILEKIDSPLSQMIITYRKLNVTLTKNIQPLLKCVVDERIHGQSITFTSTGRISMTEPNLQNVAKDFEVEMGSENMTISCRRAFFPVDSKRCLISSDFCQLEMRILAHLSQDPALLQVMKSEKDIFIAIAARWNKIPERSVTETLRNGTKQICYGIVYGMGMKALAESLKCTEQEAILVSEQFHAAYPGIRQYTDKIIKFARNNGYIETITGRRRYLEHISSDESLIKSQAERQAVNSTIQGSAADIAKSAILRIEKNIEKYREKLGIDSRSVRLVLHLHDELIFEVPEEKAKKIAKVLSITMENCVKLNVPLKVKLKIGKSWGELKEVKL